MDEQTEGAVRWSYNSNWKLKISVVVAANNMKELNESNHCKKHRPHSLTCNHNLTVKAFYVLTCHTTTDLVLFCN